MRKLVIALFLLACIHGLNAQDNRLFVKDLDLKVYISLDRSFYRIGEDVYLNVEILNQAGDKVEFNTSAYKLNNSKLTVLNLQNGEPLEEKYTKIIEDNNLKKEKPELFEMNKKVLYPDEIYKFKLNLPEYFEFTEEGAYKVSIEFDPFPGISGDHKIFISNPIFLKLKDRLVDEEYKGLVKYLKETEEKKRHDPKGTVDFMLESYQKGDWDSYFMYQDLDKIILEYDQYRNNYIKASPSMKVKLISDFKDWMMTRKNYIIDKYEILDVNQSYKDKTSVVTCKVAYKKPALYNVYIYKYNLHQEGIKWIIDDVNVVTYAKE